VFSDNNYPMRFTHIPKPISHNVGEYIAVEQALMMASALGYEHVEVFTDSKLVVGQTVGVDGGVWRCKEKHFLPHIKILRDLLASTKSTLAWLPREENLAGIELEHKRRIND
jgi:probable phosphoglycerate mutase